jgi:hypothetical protein
MKMTPKEPNQSFLFKLFEDLLDEVILWGEIGK